MASVCSFGYPNVIASPSLLQDGTPFPTLFWLTCPFLAEAAAAAESAGACAEWASRAHSDPELASALREADAEVRVRRAAESRGDDACAAVGLAGQRDPLGVKCLHVHVAYALAGIADPIGEALIAEVGEVCVDERCAGLAEEA